MEQEQDILQEEQLSIDEFKQQVLADYKLANESRQASLIGRKEVLTGKAKFGIFGDGKEIPQIAMAKAFKKGDFRSGYYRDQTFMMAIGELTVKQFFAQLYADPSVEREPASAGRQMNGHFATRSLDDEGNWKNLTEQYNSSADISPTAGQMPRLLGLAYASKLYRQNEELHQFEEFSRKGNEVAFGTIGNASTAEGIFWETVNAGGVLMVPMAISIWDDEYGISVPQRYQVAKENLTELLSGFKYDEEKGQGYYLHTIKGWDYAALVDAYTNGIAAVRENHIPAIFHIVEVTQPQGHSTSGSHERYKSKERLEWERNHDCIVKMREWIIEKDIATAEELDQIEQEAQEHVKQSQREAWQEFLNPIKEERKEIISLINKMAESSSKGDELKEIANNLQSTLDNDRRVGMKSLFKALLITKNESSQTREELLELRERLKDEATDYYNTRLHSGTAMDVEPVPAEYAEDAEEVNGFEILNKFFESTFRNNPKVFAIGEDVGFIGDVNQGMAGLQEKFGEIRITDTGIREATIAGQGIGASMRGLRPIVEIQYLDYLLYAMQIMSDDLATVYYRTFGGQKAPCIIRTRGHRLEGIWHSGSPMGAIINALRGIRVCVPRNMTKAAGFYNTLLKSDEPGLVIERLNAYRLKEKLPSNLEEIAEPLGVPEVLKEGTDITLVTYGASVTIAQDAIEKLTEANISVELIDVQTLLPFDVNGMIAESLKKTNRILFLDEDVPGGATAFMKQQVIEEQGGYYYLDSEPITLAAKPHRPAYGTDGDYFSKPNAEDVFEAVYNLMHEVDPEKYTMFF